MTRKDRAVAVAKDVLTQLRRRKGGIVPMAGVYINSEYCPDSNEGDLKDYLDDIAEAGPCETCVLGSLVLSKARLFDGVLMEQVCKTQSSGMSTLELDSEIAADVLRDVFGERQLELIESAFEVSDMRKDCYGVMPRSIAGAVVFGSRYQDDRKRLKAIMENIVENGGEFKVAPAKSDDGERAGEAFFARRHGAAMYGVEF